MKNSNDTFEYSNCDYSDRFDAVIADPGNRITVDDIGAMFSDPGPKWVSALMALRHRIAGCFGLKTDAAPDDGKTRVGSFELLARTESTMTLGEDDKHLDFRVQLSVSQEGDGKRVGVATFVKYNNALGRVYFFFVKPFHRVIVPAVMKRQFRQLEAEAPRKCK